LGWGVCGLRTHSSFPLFIERIPSCLIKTRQVLCRLKSAQRPNQHGFQGVDPFPNAKPARSVAAPPAKHHSSRAAMLEGRPAMSEGAGLDNIRLTIPEGGRVPGLPAIRDLDRPPGHFVAETPELLRIAVARRRRLELVLVHDARRARQLAADVQLIVGEAKLPLADLDRAVYVKIDLDRPQPPRRPAGRPPAGCTTYPARNKNGSNTWIPSRPMDPPRDARGA
jgi:hypothetical protein